MGNVPSYEKYEKCQESDPFHRAINNLHKEKQSSTISKLQVKPEKKYMSQMLAAVECSAFLPQYKEWFAQTISRKITKEELAKVIYDVNELKKNETNPTSNLLLSTKFREIVETIASEEESVSQNVIVKFDVEKIEKKRSRSSISQLESFHQERTKEGRKARVERFLTQQLLSDFHPFKRLCRTFAEVIKSYDFGGFCVNEGEYEKKEKVILVLVRQFVKLMIEGCLSPYENWCRKFTEEDAGKYKRWLSKLVMEKMWIVDNQNLYQVLTDILFKIKVPLKINLKPLVWASSTSRVNPEALGIDKKFQINGHYFQSIFQISELTSITESSLLLKQLNQIKNSICLDIDIFHTLEERGQIYEIDSDNILGIVTYLLCRIAGKINQIYIQLLYLKIVYGDEVYFKLGVSSYMYSTIIGAFQYLESQNFKTCLDEWNQGKMPPGEQDKSTKLISTRDHQDSFMKSVQ